MRWVVLGKLMNGFSTETNITYVRMSNQALWFYRDGDSPPVTRITFPERSGISLSGLKAISRCY